MTRDDLIKRLQAMPRDDVVVISDGKGWWNIEEVVEGKCVIKITMDLNPVFSDE